MESTATEFGKLPIPETLRRKMKLEPGRTVRWEQVSPTEWRVTILPSQDAPRDRVVPNPVAALDFAREHGLEEGSTAEWMRLIRGDDWEE